MAPNPRVAKAFRAMRDLGIPEEKVKPILKNLLKVYEKNWELIEEENYRALADAIFETEETEAAENKQKLENPDREEDLKKEAQVHDETERPLKRLRMKHQEDQASPSFINSSPNLDINKLKKPKLEADELPEAFPQNQTREMTVTHENTRTDTQSVPPQPLTRSKGKQPVSPKSLAVPERSDPSQPTAADRTRPVTTEITKSNSNSSHMRLRDRGKEPLLPQKAQREKGFVSERSSHAVRIREPTVDQGIILSPKQKVPDTYSLIKPKDEPFTDDMPQLEVPVAAFHPADDEGARDVPISALNGPVNIQSDAEATLAQIPRISLPCNGINEIVQPEKNGTGNHCEVDKETEPDGLEHTNSQSLVVVQNGQLKPDDTGVLHDLSDIAKGHERVVITLENRVNSECPPSFHYIPKNVVFQNAYVNFSLARIGESCCSTCLGDCLLSSTPCACAHETGGEFAYTSEGLVKEELLEECISMNRDPQKHCLFYCKECPLERSKCEEILEPCKGHLVRNFIKECWWKCGCSKQCGNRVVQRGITRKLQVFMTPAGKGWGLRTLEDLPKGAFVCEYVGEVLTNAELYDRVSRSPKIEEHAYPVLLDADWGSEGVLKDEEALCLDATYYGNVARFINHRCFDSTLVEIPVEVETPDHHYYHLAFFTTRKVKALEELTWDYGIDFDDHDHPVKAFRCRCGSKFCRNIKRPSRSRSASSRR